MATVELEVPARPEYVAVVRLALASLGRLEGFDEAAVEDLRIAVSEATTSAMLVHQEAGIEEPVTISWTRADSRVIVEVCDRGSGGRRPLEPANDGLQGWRDEISMALIESIVDSCEMVPRGDGPGNRTRLSLELSNERRVRASRS
jgi:anti-sigma regulatory factor (Ser/Thr protein kinase)